MLHRKRRQGRDVGRSGTSSEAVIFEQRPECCAGPHAAPRGGGGGGVSLSPEAVVCLLHLRSRKALEQSKQGREEC